ncbi:MAG: ATP-grasp domain-containing protein [Spirochaetes bacterium]|nr:ATP-grasp domain-containing protein [Spirochaetota bacterium]
MTVKAMRVGLTYDLRDDYKALGYDDEAIAEFDSIETIDAIDNTLKQLGFITERIGHIRNLVLRLAHNKHWDIVFNIAEGMYGIGREAQIPALLDAYTIPYTFSDPLVMALTLNKAMTKQILRDHHIPTPPFVLINTVDDIAHCNLTYPLFAKPYAEGTGKGISASSIINNSGQLETTCVQLLQKYKQPVLVEEYLPGREFTVGIVGSGNNARAIGVIEIIVREHAEENVYSYTNKEKCEELVEYKLACDTTAQSAITVALQSWKVLGCRDAGRVDIKCDSYGNPNFLEVNPLAGLHPTHSDLPIICTNVGISYEQLIATIMYNALERYSLLDKAPKNLSSFIIK